MASTKIILLLAYLATLCRLVGLSHLFEESPICQHGSFRIRASILLHDKLFLIVSSIFGGPQIVHEIPLFDISLQEGLIYLDNSNPTTLHDKWGFALNESFVTAFGVHQYKVDNRNVSDNLIVFAFKTGNQVYNLTSKQVVGQLPSAIPGKMVLSLDNSGYVFAKQSHWLANECTFKEGQFELSPHQYSFLINARHRIIILKKVGHPVEETLVEWSNLSGFIFYNHVYLFNDRSVYILEDNREFGKTGFEYFFQYQNRSLKDFFRCQRDPLDYEEKIDDNPYDKFYQNYVENESMFVNIFLFTLLLIMILSFYARSKIIQSKARKYQ